MIIDYKMVATTLSGFEEILAKELLNLGARNIKVKNRAVEFIGDLGFMYKANLNLRTAIRILKPIFNFKAKDEFELYSKIYSIDWTRYISISTTFSINTSGNSNVFKHSKYTSLKSKDAIVDFFRDKYGKRPSVDLESPDIKINLHVRDDQFTVSLDSSGDSLHKRGYKLANVKAPISEVFAASLILASEWNRNFDFYDPMCGSGTFLIEAAMIAFNIPSNIFRDKFSFENWSDYNPQLWEKIKHHSLEKEVSFNGKILGTDNSYNNIRIAKSNVKNALMEENIEVRHQDFFSSSPKKNTHVIFNPPYGERMPILVEDFYKKIGDTLKQNYQGCTVWIISSDIENIKMIGLKPSKKIKVFNGRLECRFLKFEIYEGSKKRSKNNT